MKYTLKSGEQFIVDGYTSEGEHKVLNVLDTNTDISTLESVSYTELLQLKNSSQLSPGTFYRITDYQCTTSQENTSVGPGQFDIVVQAISESELSEKGRAVHHNGDSYFLGCKVESWEVNYTLDNNKNIYFWADDSITVDYIVDDRGGDQYNRYTDGDITLNGNRWYAWKNDYYTVYTFSPSPEIGDDVNEINNNIITTGAQITEHQTQGPGRGVIYWMKDEFGNECPYDFKHLKFLDSSNNDYAWTFNKPLTSIDNPNNLPTKTIINAKIWVDDFWDSDGDSWKNGDYSESEIAEDYTLNRGGQVYDYTGNTVNYDGETLYVWRFSADSEDKGNQRIGYLFTTSLDYSDTTVADKVSAYAVGSSEDTGDIYKNGGSDNNMYGRLIYHGTYSEETTYDLESIVDDLSSITAEMNIDNFVDSTGKWSYDWSGPEDLENAPEDEIGYYQFAHECVQYDGKILFLWKNNDIDFAIFTTGLDYSNYTAVDQINPIFALARPEGSVIYDIDNDLESNKTMRSIVVSASYSGPSIPKGNLFDPTEDSNIGGIMQNLTSSIEYNIIPIKYNELGAQILDLTQIYYGPKKGYPYSKEEIDEAHKVIAFALNEQKETLDKTIPFPEIIEVEHASNSVTQELNPWKYYIFGEVSSLEVSFSEEVSEYTPIYRFLFTAASSSTRLVLPQDCSLASGHSLVMAEGKSYEITIINNIVRVISATLE